MDKEFLYELKKHANELKPEFNLGKNGITDSFLKSILVYLKVHNIVKIKVLIAEDKEALKYYAQEIAKELNAELVEMRGYTFTIYKGDSVDDKN